jgi:acetolactate synthase-1/2/3 large subunit
MQTKREVRALRAEEMSGAEALLRCLRRMGVERIFASPGSEWSPLYEALAKPYAPGEIPQYLSTRHEETAVGMASGYAKLTGKLPAVVIHTTVGSLHATMAMRAALHERVPMVVLAGESIAFGEAKGEDPGYQWLRVLADIGGPAALVERCAKWSFGLNTASILTQTIQRACPIAMAAPQGPAFVSVPMEFMFESVASILPAHAAHVAAPAASPETIEELASLLENAKNPVILSEELGRSASAVEKVVALAELLGAPVLDTWYPAYVNFPRDHPLYAGAGPTEFLGGYIKESDVVLLLEAVSPWHPPSALPGPGTKVAALAADPLQSRLPFSGIRTDLLAAGDVERSLAMLLEHLRRKIRPGARAAALERWGALHAQRRRELKDEAQAAGSRSTIDTRWVVHELDAVLPREAIVVDETITHRRAIHSHLTRLAPGRFIEGAYGGLGTGLGTALGVKAAAPERPVVLLIGDGSFNYNPVLASLGACQEHRLPVLTVIFNNFGYLSQKSGVPAHYPEGWAARSRNFAGTSIAPSPDYAALARVFDGYGERVEDPAQVRGALERGFEAIANGRLALLDIRLEPTNR